jgi:hypothetical protein
MGGLLSRSIDLGEVKVYTSYDMRRIVVKDLEGLKNTIETNPFVARSYRFFIPDDAKISDVKLMLYPHDGGCYIPELGGRFWVYARIKYTLSDRESYYDAALWKILKRLDRRALSDMLRYIEIR